LYSILAAMWFLFRTTSSGLRGGLVVEELLFKMEGGGFFYPNVSLDFFIDIIYPAALWLCGSTQPPTEIRTRIISWLKEGRCVELTTFPHSCDDCFKILEPQPLEALRACQGL
jgi:hypothetical protein